MRAIETQGGRTAPAPRPDRAAARARALGGAGRVAGFGLVEVLVATMLLAVGLLAVAGVALSAARQTRSAQIRTDQALVGQQVLELLMARPFAELRPGLPDTAVTVGGRSFRVSRSVTPLSLRRKMLEVTVQGAAGEGPKTFMTRVHRGPGTGGGG